MLQGPPSPEDELHLDQEIRDTVRKIIRDFVSSWYSSVSSEGRLEAELHQAMSSMAVELKLRARKVDRKVGGVTSLCSVCVICSCEPSWKP